MAILLTEDWTGYVAGTLLKNIAGWTTFGAFPANEDGLRVSSISGLQATNKCLGSYNTGSTNHYSQVVAKYSNTAGVIEAGPAVRVVDELNWIGFRLWGATGVRVYHSTDSSKTDILIETATVTDGDVIKLEIEDDVLRLFINGVQIGGDVDVTGIHGGNNAGLYTQFAQDPIFGDTEIGTFAAASNTITIDEYENKKIFATYGATRSHTISGTYSGAVTPTSIEYRIEESVGGAIISDWTVLDATPSTGVYSGTVNIPRGNYYVIKTRFSNDITIETQSLEVGFGILGEFGGQSNTVFVFSAPSATTPNTNVAIFDGTSSWTTPSTGLAVTDALNQLAIENNCVVGAYSTALGGTTINQHLPAGNQYASREAKLTAAGGELNFFWWGQGESDANSFSTYQAKLGDLYTDILTRTGKTSAELPMFIVQLGRNNGVTGGDAAWQGLRDVQTAFALATDGVFISHQTIDLPMTDTLHRTTDGSIQEALRFSDTFKNVVNGQSFSGRGPIPTSAVLVGDTLAINHNLNGSAFLTCPPTATSVYEISDDDFATLITVNSVGTPSANVIELVLSETPATAVKIRSHQGQDFDVLTFPTGDKTYNSQAVMVEPIYTTLISNDAVLTTLNMSLAGIADGPYDTRVINAATSEIVFNGSKAWASGATSVSDIPLAAGTELEYYAIGATEGGLQRGVTV